MERKPKNEQSTTAEELAVLKSRIDGILKPDPEKPKTKEGNDGFVVAREENGIYDVSFLSSRTLHLQFTSELEVLDAYVEWEEGDPTYYDDEFEPLHDWRKKKWLEDFRKQQAEGRKILRFGDEKSADVLEMIYPDEITEFVRKMLHAVEAELTNPERNSAIEFEDRHSVDRGGPTGLLRLLEGGFGSVNQLPSEGQEEDE